MEKEKGKSDTLPERSNTCLPSPKSVMTTLPCTREHIYMSVYSSSQVMAET